MSYSMGGLTAYVDEHRFEIITQTLYGSKTGELMNYQDGIKYKAKINILTTNAQFQAGSCTWNASGSTALTQREIEVKTIQIMETLCVDDLEPYFVNKDLKKGFNPDDIPFEKQFVDLKADLIQRQLEIAYWQGDTASANANLKQFLGWIKILDTAAASVNGNPTGITTGTGIVAGNVVGIFNGVEAAIPSQIIKQADVAIFCGTDVFRTYRAALTVANLYHYNPVETGKFEMVIPGTNITVYGLDGLNGTNRIFAGRKSNFYIGTDMLHEYEKFHFQPDSHGLSLEFLVKFKVGVQVAFPDEIVSFKLV